jgi:hypothetical protein
VSKTAEELYEERLEQAVREVVLDFIDGGVGYEEAREVLGLTEDPDFISDVVEAANGELDTMIQRWLDD